MAPQPNTIPTPDDLPASAESVASGKDLHQDRSSSLRCRRCVLTPALTRCRLHGGRKSAKPQVANVLTQPHPFRDDNLQPAGQRADEIQNGDLDAEIIEPGLGGQPLAQPRQPVAPGVVVAEVVAAGQLARLLDEPVRDKALGAHDVNWSRWTAVRTAGASGLSSHRNTTNPRRRPPVSSQ